MSLSVGRSYLAIPGPSVVPDQVLQAMHCASPNIYEGALVAMTDGMIPDLRAVARTSGHAAIYIGNGHAAWEAALSNVLAPGDEVLVPVTGRFGWGWAEMAEGIGAKVVALEAALGAPMDPAQIEAALRADTEGKIKAVMAVHVDTSTSVRSDIAAVRRAIDAAGHSALLMVDCIASMGCDVFEMDAWGVDVAVTAGQKGLMLPPGLAFVFFNDRAAAVRAAMPRVSRYWDWVPRANPKMFFEYFAGTAPTQHLYGLRASLDMLHSEGMEQVWTRHAALAEAIWAACDAWGAGGAPSLTVPNAADRSHAVTAVRIGAPHGTRLRKWVEANTGITLGIGLGMSEPDDPKGDGFFRIGHMGHVNAQMVMATLGSMQAAFVALDIPHGPGALDAAAQVIAKSA